MRVFIVDADNREGVVKQLSDISEQMDMWVHAFCTVTIDDNFFDKKINNYI